MKTQARIHFTAARFLSLCAAFWFAGASSAGAQLLELEAEVTISGPRVLLQDIVRKGIALPAGWGEREIADAPPPRETLSLTLSDVAAALNQHDDMRHAVLRGRPIIDITSRYRTVTIEQLQRTLDAYLAEHAEWEGRRFEVCAERLNLPHVAEGDLDITIMGLHEGPGYGRVWAEIDLLIDEQSSGHDYLRVDLNEIRPFWSATRPLSRGETLKTEHVKKRWIVVNQADRYYPADHVVEGMELRRNVRAGQMFAAGMLAEPVYVRRGEVIRVVSQRGGLTVTLRARALADGRRDERILCVNERSGRRMHVRLISPREAILDDSEERS